MAYFYKNKVYCDRFEQNIQLGDKRFLGKWCIKRMGKSMARKWDICPKRGTKANGPVGKQHTVSSASSIHLKVVGATLVEWSESLKISVTSFSGHAESIFHKKTHCHRTQFWNNQDLIIHCSYGKTHIRAVIYVIFLGLRYLWVIRIFLKTNPKLFLRRKIKYRCHRPNNDNN